MPPGPRKRRAARRKKKHEEQLRTGVLSPTAFPGNLELDDDDLSSQDGRGSESSSSELPSPISWDDHRHHLEIETEKKVKSSIEVMKIIEKTDIAGNGKDRGAGEIMEHSVPENGNDGGAGEIMEHSVPENGKDGGAGEIKEHSVPENGKDGGAGEIKEHSVPENGKDGGAGEIKEHSVPENGKDGGAGEIKVHSVPENGKVEIKVDEALPPSSSPVPNSPKSAAIPISNLESSKLEHELEKIECSVPLSEHASQADLETIEIVTEAKRGEGMPVSSLSDESARKIEVKDQKPLPERQTAWWSCCGLFDTVVGENRKKSA